MLGLFFLICVPSLAMGLDKELLFDSVVNAVSVDFIKSYFPLPDQFWTDGNIDSVICLNGRAGPITYTSAGNLARSPGTPVTTSSSDGKIILESYLEVPDFRFHYEDCSSSLYNRGMEPYSGLANGARIQLVLSLKDREDGCIPTIQTFNMGDSFHVKFDADKLAGELGKITGLEKSFQKTISRGINKYLNDYQGIKLLHAEHCPSA